MMHPWIALVVAAGALGGVDVTVQPRRPGAEPAPWARQVGNLDHPSERTEETLRRFRLERSYRHDPAAAIDSLEQSARSSPDAEVVFALAELSWIEGRRIDARRFASRRGASALDRYVDTVAYAHDFLFDPEFSVGLHGADPRYLMAINLYNGSLDRLIHAAQSRGKIQPGDTLRFKIHGVEQAVKVSLEGTSWAAEDVDELLPCSDFEVSGLDSRSRQYGIGVPLIGIRRTDHSGLGEDEFYPAEMAFPITAIVRPNSRIRDSGGGEEARACTLVLADPVRTPTLGAGREAPAIEADVTTPLAYMWSRTDLSKFRWTGLLRPGEPPAGANLVLLAPYDPKKIPVVMVHGLWSSPLAWLPMLNEMLRDPRIRDQYQFLLYVYPTGVPLPIAASGLRDALTRAQQTYDPSGDSPTFRRMVLLGHSMGGLLSHAMVATSDNRWWELNTVKEFGDIAGPPNVLAEVSHYSFFGPLPFVSRVVFLATPHRGSDLARRIVGRVSSGLIAEPDYYSKLLAQLIKDNPGCFDSRTFKHVPTSIETLEPPSERSPNVLSGLLRMKVPEQVEFHSIIGAQRAGGLPSSSDGVVPYWSSHFDAAKTEKVVESGHDVQAHPAAIQEVKTILLRHLGRPADAAPRVARPEPQPEAAVAR